LQSLPHALRVLSLFGFAALAALQLFAEKPAINKIDPPDWFVSLPAPMLLVHGSGLAQAHFSLSADGVTLERTQYSPNGHWAFLWLKIGEAGAQTIQIKVSNDDGSESLPYQLRRRLESPEAHRGFDNSDLIYLIMTDRFADGNPSNNQPASDPEGFDRAKARAWHGGDFAGIEQRLDYLQSLGVTALWTTPVYDNGAMSESYHGYSAVDLYGVDRHFGTLGEYRHLSAALHARGMKLIIDLVPNHIAVEHPWVADPPTPDWFHGTLADHRTLEGAGVAFDKAIYNLTDLHATPFDQTLLTESWFTKDMPDMNQENPLVAQYLIQNALWWVETAQLDAIRIDTYPS
jgi:neopullulanase